MSDAIATKGSTLQIEDPSTQVYSTEAEVKSVAGPDQSSNVIEVTPLSATTRQYITGLNDPGNLSLELNYTSTAYATFCDLQESGSPRLFKFNWSDGSNVICSGIVDQVGATSNTDDAAMFDVNIKLSGVNTRASS